MFDDCLQVPLKLAWALTIHKCQVCCSLWILFLCLGIVLFLFQVKGDMNRSK